MQVHNEGTTMNARTGKPRSRERRGVAAVEVAVVAPIFVLILFGIVEFGSMFFVRNTMVHAARSGARQLAIQGATEEEAIAIAQNTLAVTNITGATITAQNAYAGAGDDAAAREVWVQIDLPARSASLLGDPLNLFPANNNITVRATLRKEGELITGPAS